MKIFSGYTGKLRSELDQTKILTKEEYKEEYLKLAETSEELQIEAIAENGELINIKELCLEATYNYAMGDN